MALYVNGKAIDGKDGMHHYSTDEHIVGTWIDGSPLYEKTIDCGALPSSTVKNVAHGISNLATVVSISGVASSSANISLSLPYVNGSNDRAGIYADNTNINIATSTDLSSYTSTIITVRYTKSSS